MFCVHSRSGYVIDDKSMAIDGIGIATKSLLAAWNALCGNCVSVAGGIWLLLLLRL